MNKAEAKFEHQGEREPKDADANQLGSRSSSKTWNKKVRNGQDAPNEQRYADQLGGGTSESRNQNRLAEATVHDGQQEDQ